MADDHQPTPRPRGDQQPAPEGPAGVTTDEQTHRHPGTNVTGADTPGGGGTQPLEFDEDGRPIPPSGASRGGQAP